MTLADVSLDKWIEFTNNCIELDAWLVCAQSQKEGAKKQILLTNNYVEHAQAWAKFFDIEYTYVDALIIEYDAFMKGMHVDAPKVDIGRITAGQFIDDKIITSSMSDSNVWQQLKYIIAIYCTDKYDPYDCLETSDMFKSIGCYKMDVCVQYMKWYECYNAYLHNNYSLFMDSGEEEQPNMKAHMKRWGWVNFLKNLAKTKVFDIQGSRMNSIDCVRATLLDDVLTWASEEKDSNIASMRDMELNQNKS